MLNRVDNILGSRSFNRIGYWIGMVGNVVLIAGIACHLADIGYAVPPVLTYGLLITGATFCTIPRLMLAFYHIVGIILAVAAVIFVVLTFCTSVHWWPAAPLGSVAALFMWRAQQWDTINGPWPKQWDGVPNNKNRPVSQIAALRTAICERSFPRWDQKMKWRDIPLALLGMLFGRERKEIPACLIQWLGVAAILLSGHRFIPDWPLLPAVGAGLLVLGVILIFVLGGLGPIPCMAMAIVMPPILIAMAFERKPNEEGQESQQHRPLVFLKGRGRPSRKR